MSSRRKGSPKNPLVFRLLALLLLLAVIALFIFLIKSQKENLPPFTPPKFLPNGIPALQLIVDKKTILPEYLILSGLKVPVQYVKLVTFQDPGGLSFYGQKKGWSKSKRTPTNIVIHDTVSRNLKRSYEDLKGSGYATHFIIDDDGTIYQTLDPANKASHAGDAWNKTSIGIDIVNPISTEYASQGHPYHKPTMWSWKAGYWDLFPAQVYSLEILLKALCSNYGIPYDVPRNKDGTVAYRKLNTSVNKTLMHPTFKGVVAHGMISASRLDGNAAVEHLFKNTCPDDETLMYNIKNKAGCCKKGESLQDDGKTCCASGLQASSLTGDLSEVTKCCPIGSTLRYDQETCCKEEEEILSFRGSTTKCCSTDDSKLLDSNNQCCPKDKLTPSGECCNDNQVVTVDGHCCHTSMFKDGKCCPWGSKVTDYGSVKKCCPNEDVSVEGECCSEGNPKAVDGKCCPNWNLSVEGECCPEGKKKTTNGKCCHTNLIDSHGACCYGSKGVVQGECCYGDKFTYNGVNKCCPVGKSAYQFDQKFKCCDKGKKFQDCVHGTDNNCECVCDKGWTQDSEGKCTVSTATTFPGGCPPGKVHLYPPSWFPGLYAYNNPCVNVGTTCPQGSGTDSYGKFHVLATCTCPLIHGVACHDESCKCTNGSCGL